MKALLFSLLLFVMRISPEYSSPLAYDEYLNGDYESVDREHEISGGHLADKENWPFMASLVTFFPLKMVSCSAEILNEYFLLTAAHCVDDFTVNLVIVEFGHDPLGQKKKTLLREIEYAKMHDMYNFLKKIKTKDENEKYIYDIAIIKLREPIVLRNKTYAAEYGLYELDSVPLPQNNSGSTDLSDIYPESCIALGYGLQVVEGYPEVNTLNTRGHLMEVDYPLVEQDQCKQSVGEPYDTKYQVCAGHKNFWDKRRDHPKAVLPGDSGGALMCQLKNPKENSNPYVLVGLTSMTAMSQKFESEDEFLFFGIFSKVKAHLSWIKSNIVLKEK